MIALAACTPEKPATGPETVPTQTSTVPTSVAPEKGPDPYLPTGPFGEEALPTVETAPLAAGTLTLAAAPAGVGAPPSTCADQLKIKAAESPSCADRTAALAALDAALAKSGSARDAALAVMEGCAGLPAGLVRALRIDLSPAECGDVLAEPILKAPPKDLRADIHETLYGQALAARLARAGGARPKLDAPYTRERVEKYTAGPLGKWMKDVATAVQDMSGAASKLHFYGGAIAAVAAGVADLALVEAVRGAPIPDEFQKDEERKNVYYGSLDERLEPRKTRGRDAALIGLKKFAEVGAIADDRVREARRLLSKLYGGRRIDALDRVIVAPIPSQTATTVEERLAAALPTFYAGVLLDAKLAAEPRPLALLAGRGLPLAHRKALAAASPRDPASPPDPCAPIAALAFLSLGQTYWRATDFESAAKALSAFPAASRTPEIKLTAALAIGLRNGPKDAIEMMVKSPLGMNDRGQRAALDALAAEGTPWSGAAAFDSAYLMEIAAPEKADGVFFKSLAKRYEKAAELLTDAKQKAEAQERAKAALATANEAK